MSVEKANKYCCIFVYMIVLILFGQFATRFESTNLNSWVINLWYTVPMTIAYMIELLCEKSYSYKEYLRIAIVNTLVLFSLLSFSGASLINDYINIPVSVERSYISQIY